MSRGSDGSFPWMVGGLMGSGGRKGGRDEGGDPLGSCGFKALNGKNDTTAERDNATFLVSSLLTTSCLTLQGVYHL